MKKNKSEILDANNKIDRAVVAAFADLEKRVPVTIRQTQGAAYTLTLPLDRSSFEASAEKKDI